MNAKPGQLTAQPTMATRILYIYLWLTMSLLFIQGSGSLLLRLRPDIESFIPGLLATIMNGNTPHATVHIVWGTIGLIILITQRSYHVRLRLGLTFGLFYTLLGILGIFVHNPFGLRLGWQEDLFHLTVGPLMLILVWFSWHSRNAIQEIPGKSHVNFEP
jgi:Domain of unknown function (DUF4383)